MKDKVPYNIICAAKNGDNDAVAYILKYFEPLIVDASKRMVRTSKDTMTEIVDEEISIGDFVLTGGELPALCIIDSVSRNIEGTLGKIESAHDDSFADGLLEYPHYTKPREYRGLEVPEVLLNGNHKLINEFRMEQKIARTKAKRPDLYEKWKSKNKN